MKTMDRDLRSYVTIVDSFINQAEIDREEAKIISSELRKFITLKLQNKEWVHPVITKFCTDWYREFYRLLDNQDPYKNIKKESNERAQKLLQQLQPKIKTLRECVMLSIVGNKLDFGASLVINPDITKMDEMFQDLDKQQLEMDDSEQLESQIKSAKSMLFLTDNAGEVIFDIPLLQYIGRYIPRERLFIGAKGAPMLNDVTAQELKELGFEQYGTIISTGSNCFGLHEDDVSTDFKRVLKQADLVIAKGQAYMEFSTEHDFRNWFNLLLVKYPIVAKPFGTLQTGRMHVIHSARYAPYGKPYDFSALEQEQNETPCSMEMIDAQEKIKTCDALKELCRQLKQQGKILLTTNGSFDIIHAGHVLFLEEAKRIGIEHAKKHGKKAEDVVLVVGMNSDASVKAYKNPDRPIIPETYRATMLAGLASVDYVTLFDETAPMEFIKTVAPDLHFNAATYGKDCIERPAVEMLGGKVVLIGDLCDYSTTKMISKIIELDKKERGDPATLSMDETKIKIINEHEPLLDFSKINRYPLQSRKNKFMKEDMLSLDQATPPPSQPEDIETLAQRIVEARTSGKEVVIMMGGHPIKVGLSKFFIDLMQKGIITLLGVNGAFTIHDFEMAMIGQTSEDVATGIEDGTFGMAKETGVNMNQAIKRGAVNNWGMGYSLGKWIDEMNPPHKELSILWHAYKLKIPVCVHVAIGTDIIHQHPDCDGASVGKTSYLDFKLFTTRLAKVSGGVIMNVGSAVVMPEVFLKSITMTRNLGYPTKNITTANLDMIRHYRPLVNVVERPTLHGGRGLNIIDKHEKNIPALYHAIIKYQREKREGSDDDA